VRSAIDGTVLNRISFGLLVVCLLLCSTTFVQSNYGAITGIVNDPQHLKFSRHAYYLLLQEYNVRQFRVRDRASALAQAER
jgi:predicted ester cyclase